MAEPYAGIEQTSDLDFRISHLDYVGTKIQDGRTIYWDSRSDTAWEPEITELPDYETDPTLQAAIDKQRRMSGKFEKLAGKTRARGGSLLASAKEMMDDPTSTDYYERISGETDTAALTGEQQRQRDIEKAQSMLGEGQSNLLKNVVASRTGEEMRTGRLGALEATEQRAGQQFTMGQTEMSRADTLLGQAGTAHQSYMGMVEGEASKEEQRDLDQIELLNRLAGEQQAEIDDDDVSDIHTPAADRSEDDIAALRDEYNSMHSSTYGNRKYWHEDGPFNFRGGILQDQEGNTMADAYATGKVYVADGKYITWDDAFGGFYGGPNVPAGKRVGGWDTEYGEDEDLSSIMEAAGLTVHSD